MLLVTKDINQYSSELSRLILNEEFDETRKFQNKVSPYRASKVLLEIPSEKGVEYLSYIDAFRAASITSQLPFEFAASLLKQMPQDKALAILDLLPPESAADLIDLLPPELVDQASDKLKNQLSSLCKYEEGTAGSVMSPYFLAIDTEALVEDVIEAVRVAPRELERTAYVYVMDSTNKKLQGVISLRDLITSKKDARITEVMLHDIVAVRANDDALEAAKRIRSRNFKMLPVVDDKDQMVGVITMTQAMDIFSEDLADEFSSISASSPEESFFTPPKTAIRNRLPWMAGNIFLNLGAVAVISSFEETLVQVAILAAFLPMITDMGGNVGIQALSVSIRSMALGEARLRDFWKAVRKELTIGVFNGLFLGLLFAILAYFLEGNIVLGLVAGAALATNVLVAGVVGGTMPFLIKRLGKDPAMMTGPVLTTITDITGVSIYLGLSTVFLSSLL